MDHWGSFNIPFLLVFSEIIPCEESTHLIQVKFITKLLFFFYWKDLIICNYVNIMIDYFSFYFFHHIPSGSEVYIHSISIW